MNKDLKKCGSCQKKKNKEEFNFKNKKTGLRQSKCKQCTRLKSKEHYNENKEYYIKKARVADTIRVEKNRYYIWSVLKKSKCIDCGNDNPLVLDFDHKKDKELDVSKLVFSVGIEKLKNEIKKCEIRCCNCHKIKTNKIDGYKNWRSSI